MIIPGAGFMIFPVAFNCHTVGDDLETSFTGIATTTWVSADSVWRSSPNEYAEIQTTEDACPGVCDIDVTVSVQNFVASEGLPIFSVQITDENDGNQWSGGPMAMDPVPSTPTTYTFTPPFGFSGKLKITIYATSITYSHDGITIHNIGCSSGPLP